MKNITKASLVAVIYFMSCSSTKISKPINNNLSSTDYKVYKIDSLNNYYLIYAKRSDSLYKIVSKKITTSKCKQVKVGKSYNFELYSVWNNGVSINGVNIAPGLIPNVECMGFDSVTTICIERDSINDLYIANNLKGLCITP
jgi:arginine deiminase